MYSFDFTSNIENEFCQWWLAGAEAVQNRYAHLSHIEHDRKQHDMGRKVLSLAFNCYQSSFARVWMMIFTQDLRKFLQ